ncbi:MAG: Ig-like domain-containing protein [Melioribacteraceae bacterium]
MKRIILLIIGLSFCGLSSFNAQSLAGYKIYINPGHGGHDSNDREIPLGNGVTFWESEGNLSKGLYLKAMLEDLGATVIMSRVTNTSADDLPLSQIAALANTNNVDFFHSIHSNAFNAASNYTLMLFKGTDSSPATIAAKEMGAIMALKIHAVNRTTSTQNRGDMSFLGYNLGVLNPLSMPGTLSEGSFHDYTPESWRLKNESYLKHEAWAIARAFLQYFKVAGFPNGIAAGILRDELETVPASYQPISSTNDRYKPLNKIKVRLEPGGKTYAGDEFNNGYYFFDNLTPGNYKLYFDYEKMKTDSASVVVKANESVFIDKLMILNPILDPPKVLSYSPADSVNEVSNTAPIVIDFDIRMNTIETQNAFSISPAVTGSFKWDTDFKKLTFTPSKSYLPGGKYLVTISTSAKTHFGIYLPQKKSFSFTTRSKLILVSTYPVNNATDISTSVLISVKFDRGIDASTLANKVTLTDSEGNRILVTANQSKYSIGIIDFESKVPLNNNTLYRITLKAGIGDVEYVTFPQEAIIEFKTEKNYTFTGNILEGFETANVWQSPLLAPNTTGIINSQTSFEIYSLRKKSGDNSGKLEYGFSGNNGVVELALLNPIVLGESSPAGFGIWVFGDNSKNILEYRFSRRNSSEEKVKIDTISWTGWKLKKILLNEILGTGAIQFKSIDIVQTGGGSFNGKIFFDECISNIITDVHEEKIIPEEFHLAQNYPNPFNPSTTIQYTIPVETRRGESLQHVILKVYDMLGREVATLVDEDKIPGNHEVKFNGKGLASGMYIYRIQSGNFTDSKKLILLK